jgi:hypothetical protein
LVVATATQLLVQTPSAASIERERFNQVFVKVIVPVTPKTPNQDGHVVESWVAEQLKQLGESEVLAVTGWVPVCDALLEDDVVNNNVWDGRVTGKSHFCPVGADIPEREKGRLLVKLLGWTPGGGEANIDLADEPGSRAVGPVRLGKDKDEKRSKLEEGLPYVAVMIAPPPRAVAAPHGNGK